ncbi:unnamed protein product [Sympodiomycopsis kandeliae]
MHLELASAASHISGLLVPTSPTRSSSEAFKASLTSSLQSRYAESWHAEDAQRGSAARALHWQPGPGGEGCSSPLLKACKTSNTTLGDAEWTMWIDPGGVSIRDGPGPGRSSSHSLFALQNNYINAPDQVRVLYGPRTSPMRPVAANLTVDFAPATGKAAIISHPSLKPSPARVPAVTVCPSTPAFNADATPGATPIVPYVARTLGQSPLCLASTGRSPVSRRSSISSSHSSSRRGSVGSMAYSTLSMDREQSSSSIGTSIPATSPPTSASWCKLTFEQDDVDAVRDDVETDQTDAFGASIPEHSNTHSPTSDFRLGEAELRGLGLEDVNFDEVDELSPEDALDMDEERCNEGDDTLRPLEQPEEPTVEAKKPSVLGHSRSSSVASNVTSFDNGNVGVLGGGVKLGGSNASSRGRSRAHSNSSNASAFSQASQRSRQRSVESRTVGWAQQQQQQLRQDALGLSNMQKGPAHSVQAPQQYPHQHHAQAFTTGPQSQGQIYTFCPPAPNSQHLQDLYHHANALQMRLDHAQMAYGQRVQQPHQPLETVSLMQRKEGPVPPTRAGTFGNSKQVNPVVRPRSAVSVPAEDLETPKVGSGSWSSPSKSSSAAVDVGEDFDVEGEDSENDPSSAQDLEGRKRVRTRGRRSRGRGAGRAARRAAAAAAMSASANGFSPALVSSPLFQTMNGGQWSQSPVMQSPQFLQSPSLGEQHHQFTGCNPIHQRPSPNPNQQRMPFCSVPQQTYHHYRSSPAMHPARPFNASQQSWHMNGEVR